MTSIKIPDFPIQVALQQAIKNKKKYNRLFEILEQQFDEDLITETSVLFILQTVGKINNDYNKDTIPLIMDAWKLFQTRQINIKDEWIYKSEIPQNIGSEWVLLLQKWKNGFYLIFHTIKTINSSK
jgi:hypothetical protein